MLASLEEYLRESDLESWDPYDLWATPFGVAVRRIYYEGRVVGRALAPLLQVLDLLVPRARLLGLRKKPYPNVLAQRALAAALLADELDDEEWVRVARERLRWLLDIALAPSTDQIAWGLPFHWQSSREYYPAGTPFITQTIYALEALIVFVAQGHGEDMREPARRAALFLLAGVRTEPGPRGGTCASYGPSDASFVYNTSAYRCYGLALASRHGVLDAADAALEGLDYVLAGQREDGSWCYGDAPEYRYVDHYHTAFVLKCLLKVTTLGLGGERASRAFVRGIAYYLDALFDADTLLPRPYVRPPRLNPFNLDGYDVAEAHGLLALTRLWLDDTRSDPGIDIAKVEQRLDALRAVRVVKGRRSLWRRYGHIRFYRRYERWARTPYLLACAIDALSEYPAYLKQPEPQPR